MFVEVVVARRQWVLVLVVALSAGAAAPLDKATLRKTSHRDLTPAFDRFVLPNGLTVVLGRDQTTPGVIVDVSFFAGSLFEPPGKSGLAHLVEHLMSDGPAPDLQYQAMLEARGATAFNAETTFDLMTFHVEVPAHELPLALWVASDRLLARPATIDDAELERNRRIVIEERALRVDDAPYQTALSEFFRVMFPSPHPLHGMLIGTAPELASVTTADVRSFVARHLVPANAIVTLTGNVDPAVARSWLERTLGQLPAGQRVALPSLPPPAAPKSVTAPEPRARRPRVTFGWAFSELPVDVANALDFGSVLVRVYTDGALGMRVDAGLSSFLGGHLYFFEVTLAHEAKKRDAYDSAEALLRYLTKATSQDDIFGAALLARDVGVMLAIDDPRARSAMLTRLEYQLGDLAGVTAYNERHWSLLPWTIPPIVGKTLETGRFTLQSRPLSPLRERAPRE